MNSKECISEFNRLLSMVATCSLQTNGSCWGKMLRLVDFDFEIYHTIFTIFTDSPNARPFNSMTSYESPKTSMQFAFPAIKSKNHKKSGYWFIAGNNRSIHPLGHKEPYILKIYFVCCLWTQLLLKVDFLEQTFFMWIAHQEALGPDSEKPFAENPLILQHVVATGS